MSYQHQFTGQTEGIRTTAPVRWRVFDGLLAAYWEAEGEAGSRGYYLSANPRVSIFFADMSSIRVAHDDKAARRADRPMPRALYVPAGMPMWTSFTSAFAFSHLDIHLAPERLLGLLAPSLGTAEALKILRRPVDQHETRDLETLARLLAGEVSAPSRHDLFAENLAASLVTGILDIDLPHSELQTVPSDGRLTRAQMRKVVKTFEAGGGRRMSVAEMSEAVSLSESWFTHVFKNTTGVPPLQWQMSRRVERARALLAESELSVAEIADRLGFSDQAHFTRAFRQVAGETPAAWRRAHRAG